MILDAPPTPTGPDAPAREFELCAAWAGQAANLQLRTRDDSTVEVVYRGAWTHGYGPDFRDAMLLFDGKRLVTGAVELHLVTSGWRDHGHHTDRRYDSVALHVVAHDDSTETRTASGALVPVVVLPASLIPDRAPPRAWDLVGGDVCAESLARSDPHRIAGILQRLGDARLADRVARFEGELANRSAGQLLYAAVWDGLGYAMNRAPMLELANRLPLSLMEQRLELASHLERIDLAIALQLGVGGFLPLSAAEAHLGGLTPDRVAAIESHWSSLAATWSDVAMNPAAWTRARVRPANHPVLRIVTGATWLARAEGGLLASLTGAIRARTSLLDALRPAAIAPVMGIDRAQAIAASAVLPVLVALAEQTGDEELRDAAMSAWDDLPASSGNETTRRAKRQVAGDIRLPTLGGRGEQGLLHLDRTLCTPRRCYECPIAHAVLAAEPPTPNP